MMSADACRLPARCSPAEFETSERARQREIAAYLSAASFPPGLPAAFAEKASLSTDPTLNALTQLGALRLGCDRAFVSLIDRTYQYVISEATRSHSLVSLKCDPGDTVAIGVCKLRNCDGVCPATMMAFMDETGEWVQTGPDVVANRTRYIINNFKTHPDYMDRPYVVNYPYFTSYLEVPLVSPLGYLLGSYCVVDSKYNDFDKDELVEIMNEISAAIMDHLENVRIKQTRDRSEHLVQGLSSFIREEPAGQHPRSRPGRETAVSSARTGSAANHTDVSTSTKPEQNDGLADATASDDSARPNLISSSSEESNQTALPLASPPPSGSKTPPTTPRDDPAKNPMEVQLEAALAEANTESDASVPRPPTPKSEVSDSHGFISSANIKTTFFRAAATIRRSMDLDGLMFLDAVPTSYLNRPDQPSLDSKEHLESSVDGPFCSAIVKSVAEQAVGDTALPSPQLHLPEISLQRFIRAYPNGHLFTADELGPIDDHYAVGKPFLSRRAAGDKEGLHLKNDIAALFRVLPTAKYVIFLPLWHFQRECWYAATLGWVEDSTRGLNVGDVGLVSAFGNSVMAEVSRLEALAVSRAKSDFVSSLSHELRSPLHGIMASSELVREALSHRPLLSTLDMLDSCAKTLLDTFNNLLDHAVVTHSGHEVGSGPSPILDIHVVDLGALVEDVVEVVRVGHLSGNALQMQSLLTHRKLANAGSKQPVLITVQIAKHQWKLPVNVGAWKRIVMNIFGNAIKYTGAGHIGVELKVVRRTDKAGNATDYISFTVEDTGAGMSSDFIKYRLFTPFSQEDSHAPGMGLGLSIVQQLVNNLGGVVSIKSSLGIGTSVEILVPLIPDILEPRQPYDLEKQETLGLRGRTLCLVAPDAIAAGADTELTITDNGRKWSAAVERAIKANAGAFFGMELIVGTKDQPAPSADVYILDCSFFTGQSDQTRDHVLRTWQARVTPLVLLCPGDSGAASCLKQQLVTGGELHLHHPIGPKKLAAVVQLALQKAELSGDAAVQAIEGQTEPCGPTTAVSDPMPMSHGPAPALTLPTHIREPLELTPPPNAPSPSATASPKPLDPPPVATTTPSAPNTDKPAPPPEKTAPTIAQAQPQSTTTQHLLLVDDNPVNLKLLQHMARKLQHTFATATNGLEAVQHYKRSLEEEGTRRFSLVLMDISMPVMNGFEASRAIRQLEEAAGGAERCKIVAVSGLRADVNGTEATASGMDLFLTKPVSIGTLRETVDAVAREDGVQAF